MEGSYMNFTVSGNRNTANGKTTANCELQSQNETRFARRVAGVIAGGESIEKGH